MAKVVFLFINSLSGYQEDKILAFEENITSHRIGRCHSYELVSNCNGLLPPNFPALSYQHAYISYTCGQFYLEDNSRNGTFINGYRVEGTQRHELATGDVIQLSQETFSSERNFYIPTFFVKLFKLSDANFRYYTSLQRFYDCPLQLYRTPPEFELPLEILHSCIRERFQVLQFLDGLGNVTFNNKEKVSVFLEFLREKSFHNFFKLVTGTSSSYEEEYDLQRQDHVSHYMICLSCCQNYVIKKWFIDQEAKLLQIRWYFLTYEEKRKIITKYFSHYKKLTKKENKEITIDYLESNLEYYEIPFVEASELIKHRSVHIQNGYCFVSLNYTISAIVTDLIKTMKSNLECMKKNLHKIWHDERITSIITYIKKEIQFERFLFDNRSSSVVLSDLDKLANESFPLCMNILHYNLKKHYHLRHGGRLQYGLFLKGIGVSLQDSLTFWRHYLTKKISLNEFMKNYQYHILHSYGAVGKMADYPPQSCKTVLKAVPAYGEYHGCPFKLLQNEDMVSILKGTKIDEEGKRDILELMNKGTPQLTCKKYFELCHGVTLNESPYHPNRYFEESLKIRKGLTGECSCQKNYDW